MRLCDTQKSQWMRHVNNEIIYADPLEAVDMLVIPEVHSCVSVLSVWLLHHCNYDKGHYGSMQSETTMCVVNADVKMNKTHT